MEKDDFNLLAAKALRARLNGDGKGASQYEKELESLRKGRDIPKTKSITFIIYLILRNRSQ